MPILGSIGTNLVTKDWSKMSKTDSNDNAKRIGDVPSYQDGNPHKLNPKAKAKPITFESFPEVTISHTPPIQQLGGTADLKTLPDYQARLKYLASQV
jgi:hypothetical protein